MRHATTPRDARHATGPGHDHLVCRVCGRTDDVDRTAALSACPDPSKAAGFLVDNAEVVFWGLCPNCRKTVSDEDVDDT